LTAVASCCSVHPVSFSALRSCGFCRRRLSTAHPVVPCGRRQLHPNIVLLQSQMKCQKTEALPIAGGVITRSTKRGLPGRCRNAKYSTTRHVQHADTVNLSRSQTLSRAVSCAYVAAPVRTPRARLQRPPPSSTSGRHM
jgi:hypothetical protein